jgi:hypothetical protein
MSLTNSVECATNHHRIALSAVDPDSPELRLEVTLDAPNEQIALKRTEAVAVAVYERMLLDLTPHVAGSTRPVHETHSFTDPTGGATAVGLSAGTSVAIATGVAVLAPTLVNPVLERALLGVEAGQPVESAMVSAREMYRAAMQTDDPVASYLICYSALHLVVQFKHGRRAKQPDVDDLLMAEDSSIQRVRVLVQKEDGSSEVKNETPFTTIRNRFVHAEERGKDPEGAARHMRDHLSTFRDLTARVLRGL